jgi:hypothetical protein
MDLPGKLQTTVSLKRVSCGTEADLILEGLPEVIVVEMCYLGWQESLLQQTNLAEHERPDQATEIELASRMGAGFQRARPRTQVSAFLRGNGLLTSKYHLRHHS